MTSHPRLRAAASAAGLISLLAAALFALASFSAPLSMMLGQIPLTARLMMHATSTAFVMGDAASAARLAQNYTRAFGAIGPHMALCGLALLLCLVQFIPRLRRRRPGLHRAIGKAAATCIALGMLGAIGYLWMTPAGEVFSGEPFAAALWVQAVSTLVCLPMAIQAAREKRFQAHMGWMALLLAVLLTAPLMRLEQTLIGALQPSWGMAQVTAGLSVLVLPQTVWAMTLWMRMAGQKEIPLPRPELTLPPGALRVLAWMGAATALHEGCLAPFGLDLLAHWRPDTLRLPAVAALWGVASALMLPRLPRAVHAALDGHPQDRIQGWLGLAASAGALLIAAHTPLRDNPGFTAGFHWAGAGLTALAMSLWSLLDRRDGPQHAAWRTLAAMGWLVPAAWAPMAWALSWTGWSPAAVMASTYVLSTGFFAWHGFTSAFALPMPGPTPATRTARPGRV